MNSTANAEKLRIRVGKVKNIFKFFKDMKKNKIMYFLSVAILLAGSTAFFAFKKPLGEKVSYSFEVETIAIQGLQEQGVRGGKEGLGGEYSSIDNVPVVEKKGIEAFFAQDGTFEVRIKTLTPENELYQQTKDFFQLNTEAEDLTSVGEVVVNNEGITVFDKNGRELEKQKGDPAMAEQIASLFKDGMTTKPDALMEEFIAAGAKQEEGNEKYSVLSLRGEDGQQEITIDKATNLIVAKKSMNREGELTSVTTFISHREGDDVILEAVGEEFYFTDAKGQRVANKLSSNFTNYTVKH